MLTAKQGALLMVRKGFRVFRVAPNTKDPYRRGINEATDNVQVIEQWFRDEPRLNYGVATSGLVALDVDAKHGDQWIEEFAALGELPRTLTVVTPTGGMHIYFRGMEAGQRDISKTVQVRSRGGYLVGPGSTIDGKAYSIVADVPVAEVPPHVRERLARLQERAEDNVTPVAELDTPGAIAHAVAMLSARAGADKGDRNAQLFRLACLVKDQGVSQHLARELLLEHWCPRCTPAYDDDYEIEKTVRSAYENGLKPPGSDAVEFEEVASCPELDEWAARRAQKPKAEAVSPFVAIDVLQDPASYSPRPWLFQGDILRGSLTGFVAAGGIGKSMLTVALAVAAAANRADFIGMRLVPGGPYRAMLIANEDDYDELRGRIAAVCDLAGIDRRSLQGRLFTYQAPDYSRFLAMVRNPKTRAMVPTNALVALQTFTRENKIDIRFWDPFVELHTGNENDNTDVAAVMAAIRQASRLNATADVVVHHSRKPTAGVAEIAGDADSARGGSAFRGNVRRMFTLLRPTNDDAKRYRMTATQRRKLFRLDDGKTSYTEAGGERWYEIASVKLGNGESYGALKLTQLVDRGAEDRRAYFDILAQWILEQGGSVPLKTAAKRCKENPLLRDTGDDDASVNTLGNRIKGHFADPVMFDDIQMWWDDDAKLICAAEPLG